MHCCGHTDVGKKRKINEDYFLIRNEKEYFSAVVCDGMGGAASGNVASRLACEIYQETLESSLKGVDLYSITREEMVKILRLSVVCANKAVYAKSQTDNKCYGMGTTLVAFFSCPALNAAVNVGDSRLYTVSNRMAIQITKDHSLVQMLVDNGALTEKEALQHPKRNIILRALGVEDMVEPDMFFNIEFDYILLCTDGLSNFVSRRDMEDIIYMQSRWRTITDEKRVKMLVDLANKKGGTDNITAVLIGKE
ncbi:MAG: Stp1/IreP family PP2C-type Ser/Thr phosphatase [Clostridia bacterium]|nr:Stp1/IreP family PP2C-type Ser/Thr phosphatase [Clostridia bacterium]MBR6777686.1 Stp1/IreP family PP2C-type Ser/Thr phosphatase [Clostridia bacterium]